MEITKKQNQTNYGAIAFNTLIEAQKNPQFKFKDEKGKTILISFGKMVFSYDLSDEEYNLFKKLEADYWGKK